MLDQNSIWGLSLFYDWVLFCIQPSHLLALRHKNHIQILQTCLMMAWLLSLQMQWQLSFSPLDILYAPKKTLARPDRDRYLCKHLLNNFDDGQASKAKLEKMVKARPFFPKWQKKSRLWSFFGDRGCLSFLWWRWLVSFGEMVSHVWRTLASQVLETVSRALVAKDAACWELLRCKSRFRNCCWTGPKKNPANAFE